MFDRGKSRCPALGGFGCVLRPAVVIALAIGALMIPWVGQGAEKSERREGSRPSGARQALRAAGIDDNLLQASADGKPVADDEQELLLRSLLRIPRFSPADVERWSLPLAVFSRQTADPLARRGEFFHLDGRLQEVEKHTLPPALVQRFRFDHYYQCRVLVEPAGAVVIYARNVPKAWQKGDRVDTHAMFFKVGPSTANRPTPLFAAARLAWHPPTPLGRLGVDMGLLDQVQDDRPLTVADHEPFYQMLAAVEQEAATEPSNTEPVDSVVELFNQPRTRRGRPLVLEGTARSAIRVEVDDPEVVARFGITHYYQIGLFTADSQDNPLIVCVRHLPAGMPVGDGPDYRESIRVIGFFLKKWAYVPAGATAGSVRQQTAPLLVGQEPIRFPPPHPVRDELAQWVVGGVIVLAVLWLIIILCADRLASLDLRRILHQKV
jgi:hypothetical protein